MTSILSRTPALLLSLLFLTAGCATTKGLQADYDACGSALKTCESELTAARARVKELESKVSLAEKRMKAFRDIADRLRKAFGSDDLEIIIRNGRLVVQLPNRVLFDSGKTEIKPDGQVALDKLASVLATVEDRQFLIAGHTDNVGVKENPKYKDNWELSTLRGVQVVRYLQSKGVASGQLGAAGYSEFMPEASNDTDEGRAQNRRTEVIIMPTLDEIPELEEI